MEDTSVDFWAFDRPRVRKPPRPFVSRLVALVGVAALLVPVAVLLRQGDGAGLEAGSLPGAAVNLEPAREARASTTAGGADTSAASTAASTADTTAGTTAGTPDPTTTAAGSTLAIPAPAPAPAPALGATARSAGTLPPALGTLPATVPTTAAPTPAPTQAPRTTSGGSGGSTQNADAATASTPAPTRAPATTTRPAAAPAAPPTTAAPVTTAARPTTTAVPVPTNRWSAAEVEAIIRQVWPDDLEERALQIAHRESRLVPTAHNGWCCYGLFQIYWEVHDGWIGALGYSLGDLYDPTVNTQLAYLMYQRAGGWGPWE